LHLIALNPMEGSFAQYGTELVAYT
jgi:hypothetical protein